MGNSEHHLWFSCGNELYGAWEPRAGLLRPAHWLGQHIKVVTVAPVYRQTSRGGAGEGAQRPGRWSQLCFRFALGP